MKELNSKDIEYLRHVMGNFVVDGLGDNKIYKILGGYTNEAGIKQIQDAVREQGLKMVEPLKEPTKVSRQTKSKYHG